MDPMLFWCLIAMCFCIIVGTLRDSAAFWGMGVAFAFASAMLYFVL